MQRSGRQIAAPTSTYYVFDIFRTQNDDRHVEFTVIRNKCIVGAATCRPLRIDTRAVPTKRYPAGCTGGVVPFNRTGCICNVAGGKIAAPTSTYHVFDILRTQNNDRHVKFTVKRNKCIVGAAICRPLRIDHRAVPTKRYPAGCADGVVPFTRTGCIRNVAGGRLPMELWCDCPRQSIDFDSLREAPPLQ